MRLSTRQQLADLAPTTKEELRAWFANKIQVAAGKPDAVTLKAIMSEFNELVKGAYESTTAYRGRD